MKSFNSDAFSNGQIDSKLWVCRELETLGWKSNLTHIYGGWYGVLGFLLLSREKFQVKRIESFDADPACESIADMINNNWVFKEWKFKAHTADCNNPLPGNPDLIINTSTEHFENSDWFDRIPKGTRIILQGNNLVHDDHVGNSDSLEEFENSFNLSAIVYRGSLDFTYPTWGFTRYMIIGIK
jgi:hypothetical protein